MHVQNLSLWVALKHLGGGGREVLLSLMGIEFPFSVQLKMYRDAYTQLGPNGNLL